MTGAGWGGCVVAVASKGEEAKVMDFVWSRCAQPQPHGRREYHFGAARPALASLSRRCWLRTRCCDECAVRNAALSLCVHRHAPERRVPMAHG